MDRKLNSIGKRSAQDINHGLRLRKRWKKNLVLIVSITVLLVGIIGGTLAYLVDTDGPLKNTFTYDYVTCRINEEFENKVDSEKKNISVTNTGNTNAFIRAEIIVTWQDDAGNVYGKLPVLGTDYDMSEVGANWIHAEKEYYYYPTSLAPGASTDILFSSITQKGGNPPGYSLCVEILADAIQSTPKTAVESAWAVTVTNGIISK